MDGSRTNIFFYIFLLFSSSLHPTTTFRLSSTIRYNMMYCIVTLLVLFNKKMAKHERLRIISPDVYVPEVRSSFKLFFFSFLLFAKKKPWNAEGV